MTTLAYTDCLEEMFKLQRFGIKLGLDIISEILEALGCPQHRFSAVHIAGTNGKGSVAAMLSTILLEAGFKVGCYTSPHLERFNERIAVNNTPISDDEVIAAYKAVKGVEGLSRQPTFFEFATAMAFFEFGRQGVEWAIIETGMGGRLDATNILEPALSIITNISMEHQSYLGKSIYAIAGEKAGIIKKQTPVVTGVQQPAGLKAIFEKAGNEHADVYRYGHDFRSRRNANETGFTYLGLHRKIKSAELNLQGDHQIANASLALAACEILSQHCDIAFSETLLRHSLKNVRWPGRLEVACLSPYIILDGAHNMMSARTLGRYLRSHFHEKSKTLVVGILDDKPIQSILKDLLGPCQSVVVTQPKINRAVPADKLAGIVSAMGFRPTVISDVGDAVRYAISNSHPSDLICIAGSLYVVGEAKTALSGIDCALSK